MKVIVINKNMTDKNILLTKRILKYENITFQ